MDELQESYVWVTPNTIDPTLHDMKVYDTRLNNIISKNGAIFELDFAFNNDILSKDRTFNESISINLKTGQITKDGGSTNYSEYNLLEANNMLSCGYNGDIAAIASDGNVDKIGVFIGGTDEIFPELIGQTMETQIPIDVWYIPWLGIKTKLL